MRYIGLAAKLSQLVHIKDVLEIEMIARATKKLVRKGLALISNPLQHEGIENTS